MTSPQVAPAITSPPLTPVDDVLSSLRRITRAIDIHSRQLVKTASVTGPQLRLLQLVQHNTGASLRELSQAMSLSQATVSSIMDRLENRELLVRVRSQQDKRKVHPQLTAQGAALLACAPTPLQDSFAKKFAQMPSWEQHMIIASLQRVAAMMDAQELDAAPYLDIGQLDREIRE